MRKYRNPVSIIFTVLLLVILLACSSDISQEKHGLYVENGTLMKDNQPYFGIGANYFDLFYRSIRDVSDTSHIEGLTRLAEAGIPFVRFSAGGFWPIDWKLYQDDKEKYFELFDDLVELAEELEIGLIPSLFWHFQAIADLNGETMDQFMNDQSKTVGFIKQYTGELVQRYNNSPALWGWEFGNEFSLFIDIPPIGGTIPGVSRTLGTPAARDSVRDVLVSGCMYNAYDEFAKTIREHDQVRAIFTGGSEPRAWAFNNAAGNPWVKDTEDQTRAMLLRYNSDPINTLTIRGYWNLKNSFDNIAIDEYTPANIHANEIMGLSFAEYIPYAMKWSEETGKPLFVGEWGASQGWLTEGKTWNTMNVKDAFQERLDAIVDNRVPLSAFWVYDLKGQNGTWNITFDNERAYMIDMVLEANKKLNQ
jgi:hypothetical protein